MRIFKLGDYKLAFPHILNVLPVRFHRIERLLKTTPKRPALTAIANETLCAVIRSIVLVLFLVPMLSAYGNSLYELWQMNDEQVTAPFLIAAAVLFALALVALVLVLHEWIALHGKQFDE